MNETKHGTGHGYREKGDQNAYFCAQMHLYYTCSSLSDSSNSCWLSEDERYTSIRKYGFGQGAGRDYVKYSGGGAARIPSSEQGIRYEE